ncbi:serine/threonine protein kinase [Methanosarcinaceae archaeon]|nr:serine/threonine protein kinase [Methanosarcinaceae archaeon]
MIDDVLKLFPELKKNDFRILAGIELGMKDREWVPLPEIRRYAEIPIDKLAYRLDWMRRRKLVVGTLDPYEGYRLYFEGYDALALHTYVRRKTFDGIGVEIGVGKESVVMEVMKKPELAIADPEVYILKLHREGRTSFRQVRRTREHLAGKEHFSWIYAARLAAEREYDIMKKIYPDISVPRPVDQNRHTIVMERARGSELSKTLLLEPEWHLDEILTQIRKVYQKGIIHSDLSEYNIFVSDEGVQIIDWPQYVTIRHPHADELLRRDVSNVLAHFARKYGIERDLDETIAEIRSGGLTETVGTDLPADTEEEGEEETDDEPVGEI